MRLIVTSVLAGILFSGNTMDNGRWNCTQPQWLGNPGMNGRGNLEATLPSSCRITLDSAGSIATLNGALIQYLTTENQVNSGPFQETYQGMPAVRYDLTNTSVENGYKTVMRLDTYMA